MYVGVAGTYSYIRRSSTQLYRTVHKVLGQPTATNSYSILIHTLVSKKSTDLHLYLWPLMRTPYSLRPLASDIPFKKLILIR